MNSKQPRFSSALVFVMALAFFVLPAGADMTEYANINLAGGDYQTVSTVTKEDCALACAADARCLAATWVSRAGQEPSCSLKNTVPSASPSSGDNVLAVYSYIKHTGSQSSGSCTPPRAAFTADKTSGPAPLAVHFTDTSTGLGETLWNWGDGSWQYMSPKSGADHTFSSPGTYSVNLTVSDFCGSSSAITTIQVTGTGAADNSNVRVDSVPRGAAVFIDNTQVGTTPLRLTVTPDTGAHTLRISLAGYNDYTEDLTISAGQVFDLRVTMTPGTGSGAAQTTAKPAATATSTAAGGAPLKQALKDAGSTPAASGTTAGGTGSLSISSNPAGANVYLDGKSAGATPLTIPDVPAGSHTILLTLQGYADASRPVDISAGSDNQVIVDMTAAKKTPGFAAAAGIIAIALLALYRRRTG